MISLVKGVYMRAVYKWFPDQELDVLYLNNNHYNVQY